MLITDKKALKNYAASKCLWVGIPSIEVTAKGRTFLTFYSGGKCEEIGNYAILIKSDDGINYSDPIAVCFEEGHRCFDPCLWIDPLNRLWFTWSRHGDDGLFGAICDDPDADEIVFGKEFFIAHNVMMNKPIVLSTGEWLFPIAVWQQGKADADIEDPDKRPGSFAYITDDKGKTFKKLGTADVKRRTFDEHMFVEMNNGALRVFVRTNYGIGAADSFDGGIHWGDDFDTGYGGPASRFHIRRLPSGRILLINHYNFTFRNNLTAMLSEDDGKTFPYRLMIDERDHISYPDAAVDSEGMINITYDRERGADCSSLSQILGKAREILTARISEEDIINGKIVGEKSFLKRVAYKLTDYDGDLKNPFNENDRFSDTDYADYLKNNSKNAEEIISKIFEAYDINCSNIHNLEAEELDRLIEKYKASKDLITLNQIIGLVRRANSKSIYARKNIADQICRYITDNLENNYSLPDLANEFHFSANYIRHIFKRETGITVKEFQKAQKIKKAKLLLRTGDCKIIDVAHSCGFENPAYFTEVFIKEVGISPKKYKDLK